jgi:peptidoglycan hydrolase CwlO-like protein
MAERDILKLLAVLHQTSGYPNLKPLNDRAMKTLTEMAAEEKKLLDEEAKKEAAEKVEEESKAAAEKVAAAKKAEEEELKAKSAANAATAPKESSFSGVRRV